MYDPISRRYILALALFGTVVLSIEPDLQAAPQFQGLGDLPGGAVSSRAAAVSADGSVVVGSSVSGEFLEAFRWSAGTGMVGLGDLPGSIHQSTGEGVSGDGSVVVGSASGTRGTTAFRWTSAAGMSALGEYPEDGTIYVSDVSDDGSTAVGIGRGVYVPQLSSQAMRWDERGQPHPIAGPPASAESEARAVSADGSVVTGYFISAADRSFHAFRWTEPTGMVALGDLAGGAVSSTASDVSADGSVIVGASSSDHGSEAFRWTAEEGMRGLGILPGWERSVAGAVSDDGSVIVGTVASGDPRSGFRSKAFIWDETHGMRYLQDALEYEVGLDIAGWSVGQVAGISGDGTTLVGSGRNPAGESEAWIAVIPEPGTACIGISATAGLILRRRSARYRRDLSVSPRPHHLARH